MTKKKWPLTVVAVSRNIAGSIEAYLLSNGKVVTRKQMVSLVEDGWIPGYDIAVDKYGGKAVKANSTTDIQRISTLPDIVDYRKMNSNKHKREMQTAK